MQSAGLPCVAVSPSGAIHPKRIVDAPSGKCWTIGTFTDRGAN